jgi:hypothetical protein
VKIERTNLTKTYLQGKFNESNQYDRFYPLPVMENVTDERDEPVMFEWEGGGTVFIKENPRSFAGMIKQLTPELIGRIKQWIGRDMGYFVIDYDGNFIGNAASDGSTDLYPIAIDSESLYAGLIKGNYSDPLMGSVSFKTQQNVKDEDLRMVKAEDLDFDGLSKTDVYGLTEVTVSLSSASTSQAVFTLSLDQDAPLSGIVSADIVANNDTDDSAVTLTSLTESAVTPGTYTAAYSTGIDAGDTLRITVSKTKLSHSYDTLVVS